MTVIPPPPPVISELPLGTTLIAGIGTSTVVADMDFETYSEAGFVWDAAANKWTCLPHAAQGKKGLSVVGAARYAEHPSTEVLCLAYDLKDGGGRRLWYPGMPPPDDLFDYIARGGLIEAWNVGFERHIWEKVCVPRLGWPGILQSQYRCAMAKGRAFALPGKLAEAGPALGSEQRKNADGARLLRKFSIPRNPTKGNPALRIRPEDDPVDGELLYEYCKQDIATEGDISSCVPDLTGEELAWWQEDQKINCRGVQIDTTAIADCSAIVEQALTRYNQELWRLTGGVVSAASEVQRLSAWLATRGVSMASLDEERVTAALARSDLPVDAYRALEIRATVGSASVKKLFAMANSVCSDGRLRDLYTYHGARTGRTTGNGPQPTNLPNSGPDVQLCTQCGRYCGAVRQACPWCGGRLSEPEEWSWEAVDDALKVMSTRSLECAEYFFDNALNAISGCLRGLFIAKPGHDLICADYSAIEAVALAELAGEKWRQEVFRTHGKIYEMSASLISGIPFEEILAWKEEHGSHHPLRKKGKVMELSCGYGGWVGALINFGADKFMTEEEMRHAAGAWRDASPAIVEFWGGQTRRGRKELFGMEGAALSAVLSPGQTFECRGHRWFMCGDVLYCTLLSGRHLTYHRPRLSPSTHRPGETALSYEGYNTNPKNGPMGWARQFTRGSKLAENVTQATCRDIQRHAILLQEAARYPIVLHVYDENVAEIPEGFGSIEEFERIMATLPDWAAGWPVRAAGGWRGKRYRK